MSSDQSISILIPTYRRPDYLERCLRGLEEQRRRPDEVVIVLRDTDQETATFLDRYVQSSSGAGGVAAEPLKIERAQVDEPGQVAALNRGLDAVNGDIVAILDDDTKPRPQWLGLIEAHFNADLKVGGVGGRDWIHRGEVIDEGSARVVGRIIWLGARLIGQHHLGVGGPREVDHLKGANMSYRRRAIAAVQFDTRLRGKGSQIRNDTAFSLAVKRDNWKLIYDPDVAIDHYIAPKQDEHVRGQFNASATADIMHNTVVVMLDHLNPLQQLVFLSYELLVGGSRLDPGLLQFVRIFLLGEPDSWLKLKTHYRAIFEGVRTYSESRAAVIRKS